MRSLAMTLQETLFEQAGNSGELAETRRRHQQVRAVIDQRGRGQPEEVFIRQPGGADRYIELLSVYGEIEMMQRLKPEFDAITAACSDQATDAVENS